MAFFETQMARLVGLKFRPAELDTHWEALQDLPPDALEAAVTRAQRTRVDFPTPYELRQDADLSRAAVAVLDAPDQSSPLSSPRTIEVANPFGGEDLHLRIDREWHYYCDTCHDTGWDSTAWCGDPKNPSRKPWQAPRTCDRRGAHAPHDWARHCACWDTNPALVKKRKDAERYAADPPKGRR